MLSQTAEYALRAMSWLAYTPDQLTPTATLAEKTQTPANYLAKVLQLLAQSDLIVGRRGVGGGYRLARKANEISLLDVVRAIDDLERIETCPLGLENHTGKLCPLHKVLDDVAKEIIDRFKGITLQNLINDTDFIYPMCDTTTTQQVKLTMGDKKK